jgi:hypothetical protein
MTSHKQAYFVVKYVMLKSSLIITLPIRVSKFLFASHYYGCIAKAWWSRISRQPHHQEAYLVVSLYCAVGSLVFLAEKKHNYHAAPEQGTICN